MEKKIKGLKAWSCIGVGILVLILFTTIPGAKELLAGLFRFLKSLGSLGLIIFMGLYAVMMSMSIPITMLNISLSFLYHFWTAFLIASVGAFLGCILCYVLGKSLLRDSCKELFDSYETLKTMASAIQQSQWKFVFLIWMISAPVTVKNYGLASLNVNFLPYIVVGTATCIFNNATHIFLGSKAQALYKEVEHGDFLTYEMLFFIMSLVFSGVAFAGLSMFVHKSIRADSKYEEVNTV